MIELEPFGEEVGEKEDLMRATQAIYANLERETKRQIVTKRERARAHTPSTDESSLFLARLESSLFRIWGTSCAPPRQSAPRGNDLERLHYNRGHNQALTVVYVPRSLDSGQATFSTLTG